MQTCMCLMDYHVYQCNPLIFNGPSCTFACTATCLSGHHIHECIVMFLGEKLSKKQLQNSNTIKKLRAKEKESETQLASSK